jgi:ligand-binding sensor protein
MSFETFAMVFCGKFGIYGMYTILIYIVLPIAGLLGVIISGQILIKSNYQYMFMKNSADLNNDWKEVLEILRELKERKI